MKPEDVTVITGDSGSYCVGCRHIGQQVRGYRGERCKSSVPGTQEKVLAIAAHLLETSMDDVEMSEGVARVHGSARALCTLARIAQVANAPSPAVPLPPGVEPGLEHTTYFAPEAPTFSNGAHAAFVEVIRSRES